MNAKLRRHFVNLFLAGLFCTILYSVIQSLLLRVSQRSAINIMSSFHTSSGSSGLPLMRDLSIEIAAQGLQSGLFTSVDLVKACLARIDEAKDFNSVLQVNPDALAIARDLDEERASKKYCGPLHGIPILVKDNIATSDAGLDVSAGSFAFLGAKPANESSVIRKLRDAGAVILGKTNLSEWANFRGLDVTDGWSPRGGQTLGIFYPQSSPSGSSAGSAVATALGLCVAALGTETVGSITSPAEFNNVVGLKPTRGLVANDGTIPISSRQDVMGPLTRNVKDAAYLLNFMAGRSEDDERTWNIPMDPVPDYTQFCQGVDLSNISIGVPRNAFDADPSSPVSKSFELALEILASAGAKIIDNTDFPAANEFKKLNEQVRGILRSSEFKRDISRYIKTMDRNPNKINSTEDLIAFTKQFPLEQYPERDIGKFLWTQAEGIDVDSDKYADMVQQELYFGGEGGILGALDKYRLDLLATPSDWGIANDLAAKMGYPIMCIPLGFFPADTEIEYENGLVTRAPGMPYGLSIFSKAFSDGILLQVAYAFEQLAAVRSKEPKLSKLPSTEVADVQHSSVRM